MSTTSPASLDTAVDACRPADVTPVEIDAASLESTAPEYLRDLRSRFAEEGYQPATVVVEACFAEDCSLETQAEADRIRSVIRAATFLGAGEVDVRVTEAASREKVAPALSALEERADREGVTLSVSEF